MNHASVVTHTRSPAAHVAANSSDDDATLCAYNSAFSDLGLRFRWDSDTLDVLKEFNSEIARITAYIERFHSHLLKAYDANFLAELIFQKKSQFYRETAAE
ncbi:MAG TPA: hypothetical protein VGL08_01455 [Paraburkholderia sp.]|jgi:hypothetical protein